MLPANSVDTSANPTKLRIIDAAKRCMSRWGTQKSSMNDIAREAGVSRNTLYCHFNNRDEVIAAAMLQAANDFAARAQTHIDQYTNTRERIVEGAVFCLNTLLHEPYLGLVNAPELASVANHALESSEGLQLCRNLVEKMFELDPLPSSEIAEVTELMARLVLSLLLVQGPAKRTDDDTRAFLRRRLLPAVGL